MLDDSTRKSKNQSITLKKDLCAIIFFFPFGCPFCVPALGFWCLIKMFSSWTRACMLLQSWLGGFIFCVA
jgi:hypothetical protein